jgi:hypothetical protein
MNYFLFLECTGFVTALLTIVRSVVSYFPFYLPNNKLITISFTAFFIYTVIKGGVLCYYILNVVGDAQQSFVKVYNYCLAISLILTLAVVLTANLLTVWKLLRPSQSGHVNCTTESGSTELSRHATVTIFILSALFTFFNLLYTIVLCNFLLGKETISMLFRNLVVTASVPLNSALNPFVYFIRKEEMRQFLCENFCRQRKSLTETASNTALSLKNWVTSSKLQNSNTSQLQSPTTLSAGSRSIKSMDSRENHVRSFTASVVLEDF